MLDLHWLIIWGLLAQSPPMITSPPMPVPRDLRGLLRPEMPAPPLENPLNYPMQWAVTTQPSQGRSLKSHRAKLRGQLLDFTKNHGQDNRLDSVILGRKRDVYVYLPPGYDPEHFDYPLVYWLHGAFGDEHAFLVGARFAALEKMIECGQFPPAVIICPDGICDGENRLCGIHSFFVNSRVGAFEDWIIHELTPWAEAQFALRKERSARGLFGLSAGGVGAMAIGIQHRDKYAAVAVLAAPVNLRDGNLKHRHFQNFRPEQYAWNEEYYPRHVVGVFFGVVRLKAKHLVEKQFGPRDEIMDNIRRVNPADLLFTTNLQPGELAIFLHYPSHDNFNFDSENESFAWLARSIGVAVETEKAPLRQHLADYFRDFIPRCYRFLGRHLEGPVAKTVTKTPAAPPK